MYVVRGSAARADVAAQPVRAGRFRLSRFYRVGGLDRPPGFANSLSLALRLAGTPAVAYCCVGLLALAAEIAAPLTTNSTLRFCCRPSGVSLDATGWVSANPVAVMPEAGTPCSAR